MGKTKRQDPSRSKASRKKGGGGLDGGRPQKTFATDGKHAGLPGAEPRAKSASSLSDMTRAEMI